jgi:chromosome partitioning protein
MNKYRIVVAARKGGVGKTTVACGIASILSHQGLQTLVIDLDPQSNAAYVLGVDPVAPGTAELLMGQHPFPLEVTPSLFVLPGGPELGAAKIQSLHPEDLAEIVQTLDYDAIIFDCPPGNEYLERLAIVAANTALVVTNAHPLAVMGAARVLEILEAYHHKNRRGPTHWSLVLSKIDSRRSMDKQFAPQLAQQYPNIPQFLIPQDTALSLAAAEQIPIMDYDPKSRGAKELLSLVSWIRTDHG